MAAIKAYTDLQQSKKLVKILSPKSADMFYIAGKGEPVFIGNKMVAYGEDDYDCLGGPDVLCWSLVALLDVLPNNENISTNLSKGGYRISTLEYTNSWFVDYEDETDGLNNCVTSADNPVDACVDMIIKLHELNLL